MAAAAPAARAQLPVHGEANGKFFKVPVMCVLCPALALVMEGLSSIQEVYIDIPSHHWTCYWANFYLLLTVGISIIVVRKQVTASFRCTYFFRSHLMIPVLTFCVSGTQLVMAVLQLDHVCRLGKQTRWLDV